MNTKSNYSYDLRTRQEKLEQDSVDMGVTRYQNALEKGLETESLPGMRLMKRTIDATEKAIVEFIEHAASGAAGRKCSTLPYLTKIDPLQAAFITARVAINCASAHHKFQAVAIQIATTIEDHLDIARLAKEKGGLYRKVTEQVAKATSARHRSAVFRKVVAKYGDKAVEWNDRERLLLGRRLLELFQNATGIVDFPLQTVGSANTPKEVRLTDAAMEELRKGHKQCEMLMPVHQPMIHPPRPWVNAYTGGYLTDLLRVRLVRTSNRDFMNELGGVDMPDVLDAVNAVQATAWRINRPIYDVLNTLYTQGIGTTAFPSVHAIPEPPRPAGVSREVKIADLPLEKQEEMRTWKIAASKVHEADAHRRSKVAQLNLKMTVADKFKDEEAIYFPHTLDFRGRVYPLAAYLNPQGDDIAKGLLQFAEGKPLGESGAYWLAVHIANLFGVDKVSFDERVNWTMENTDKLLESALNPIEGDRFWETADSPVCALAACLEWAGYTMQGFDYVSYLPIAMDGSCSGLQHFSALLRDPVGGAAVNLVPQEKPGDIYTAVSNRAQELSDISASEFSSAWVGKFKRSVAKHPTMTLCYSATKLGMAKMVERAVLAEGEGYLNGNVEVYRASLYAADCIWTALGDVVVAARGAMDWLQAAAKVLAKANAPIRWTTPMGLPIMQAYREEKGKRVEAYIGGQRVTLTLVSDTTKIDGRKQAAGIAPNFVHSLDGAHLMRTAQLCKANGIASLAVIHDSFGTHACDTDVLHAVIRESFVMQYTPDRLAQFRDEVVAQLEIVGPELVADLPPLPPMGTLDLEAVRKSDYLFA